MRKENTNAAINNAAKFLALRASLLRSQEEYFGFRKIFESLEPSEKRIALGNKALIEALLTSRIEYQTDLEDYSRSINDQ